MNDPKTKGGLARNTALHLALVLLLGIIAYSNTFKVPFVFDDLLFIEERTSSEHGAPGIPDISSIFLRGGGPFASRPLLYATFLVNYRIGGLAPPGYHAMNLALHLINAGLLYWLVLLTLGTPRFRGSRLEENSRLVAFSSALLFVSHPVQTEAVTYFVSRSMLLSTMFYFLGIVFFIKMVNAEKRKAAYLGGLFLAALMGAASRENFITFPVMLFLYDLFFISEFRPGETARRYKAFIPVILGVAYLAWLSAVNSYDSRTGFPGQGIPPIDYVLTQFNVCWTYLRLLVLPVNQSLDYGYPTAHTLFKLPTTISFLGYICLWAAGIILARKRPLAAFATLWFLITLTPISFIVALMDLRLGDVLFEHRAYLPGTWFFVAVSAVAVNALDRLGSQKRRVAAAALLMAIPLCFTSAAYIRNTAWRSNVSIWEDAVKKAPRNTRAHYNLAISLAQSGDLNGAQEHYKTIIRIAPAYVEAHTNLAIIYRNMGLNDLAIEHYQTAIALRPDDATPHYNLGNAYRDKGMLDEAEAQYRRSLELSPTLDEAYVNIGLIYRQRGMLDEAISYYTQAIRLSPGNASAHRNLGNAYLEQGRPDMAITEYLQSLRLRPNDYATHHALALAYQKTGQLEKAREHFRISETLRHKAEP